MPLAHNTDMWQKLAVGEDADMSISQEDLTQVADLPNEELPKLSEFDIGTVVRESKRIRKAEPSHFELLKVLGQGSFGKVFMARKVSPVHRPLRSTPTICVKFSFGLNLLYASFLV